MVIREQLLIEHSKSNSEKITNYIGDDAQRLEELMDCFFCNEYRVSQRAAMVVSNCFDHKSELMQPYLSKLVENLNALNIHIAVKRNTIRILQFVDIPEDIQATLFDKCLIYLVDPKEPIALKAFSMGILYNICKIHPELKGEVIPLIEDEIKRSESAGILSRGNNILRKMNQL